MLSDRFSGLIKKSTPGNTPELNERFRGIVRRETPENIPERRLMGGQTMREFIQEIAKGKISSNSFETQQSPECRKAGYKYGCASSYGTKERAEDGSQEQNNEDCAFSVEMMNSRKELFTISGIADGVSQSAWSDVGSRLASEAFVFVAYSLRDEFPDLTDMSAKESFGSKFRLLFVKQWNILLEEAKRIIDEKDENNNYKLTPAGYSPQIYQRGREQGRLELFQTTISGVMMGPKGGYLLNLSDGPGCIRRTYSDGRRVVTPIPIQEHKLHEGLNPDNFSPGSYFINPGEGVSQLEVIVASDGLGTLPIEDHNCEGSSDCRRYIGDLVEEYPKGVSGAFPDNMCIAFSSQDIPTAPTTSDTPVPGKISLAKKSEVSPTPVVPLSSPKKISLAKRS